MAYGIEGKKADIELLADAAQEAEFLHAETGVMHRVVDENGEAAYDSKGPPKCELSRR